MPIICEECDCEMYPYASIYDDESGWVCPDCLWTICDDELDEGEE